MCRIAQITGWIDKGLNEKAYIIPGLGDFGERRCACCLLYCPLSFTISPDIASKISQTWECATFMRHLNSNGCQAVEFVEVIQFACSPYKLLVISVRRPETALVRNDCGALANYPKSDVWLTSLIFFVLFAIVW